jgi:hypothetical protein
MSPEARNPHAGACHCGRISFEVELIDGLRTARRCNCSFCRMRGAVAVSGRPGGFRLISGEDALTLYQFNTRTARHYFCAVCGIYTHHERRSRPGEYGINVACLRNVSPFDFPAVDVLNGILHPSDLPPGAAPLIAGTLFYVASPGEDSRGSSKF